MKKFSKKLFCLMLVAIMVATAIPFGAFADGFKHSLTEDHTDGNANWQLSSLAPTAEGHTLYCKACSDYDYETQGWNTKFESHRFDPDTFKCTVCGYESKYQVVISGSVNASGSTTTVLDASTALANAVSVAGATGLNIHDGHTGSGHKVTGKSYNDATHTLTLTVAQDSHDLQLKNGVKDETTHTVKCMVTGCAYEEQVPHHYDSTTGLCECGAKNPTKQFDYTVSIWTTGNIQLAESKTVAMTEAAAEAVKTTAQQAIEDNFPSVYNDLTVSALNGATATVDHSKRTIRLVVDKQPVESHENEIQVVYDDGTITYIPRKVGSWYFSTSNLGLDDTWGTTQAKLKIYDANGSRTVQWDSEDNDAFVKATDYKVEVKGINRTVTIYFMKTSTANPTTTDAFATKYYEANTRLGVLPSLPDGYTGWYVGQEELTVDTVYHWKEKSVYAYPGKGVGSGRVHLFIYNKDNELMKNVDVTENVQDNGLITKTGLMKTIEYQTGRKNPTVAGLFDESGWAYYLNNKNSTAKAKSSVDVGRAADRQGTQNIYVVLTNVSGGSNADTSNPKTGDTAMIGTAAIVMALAAVGMGTAFYMKKKELF